MYNHETGPNCWYVCSHHPKRYGRLETNLILRKVAIFLEELGLTYEHIYPEFDKGEQKVPDFLKINPNALIPAIVEYHNNDLVIRQAPAADRRLIGI